jgi:hypothetical protein
MRKSGVYQKPLKKVPITGRGRNLDRVLMAKNAKSAKVTAKTGRNDNYILQLGTNVVRKVALRTHHAKYPHLVGSWSQLL